MQESIQNDFSFDFSSTMVEFLTGIFVDQKKPVVTEKHEFEQRHVSKLNIIFGNFILSSFWCKEQN